MTRSTGIQISEKNRLPSRRTVLQTGGATSLGLFLAGDMPRDLAIGTAAAQEPTGAPYGPLADLLRGQALLATDFGARFDNTGDDAPALQRAIDAAHEQRRPLLLPGGTALLHRPLSLRGRDVSILGEGMTSTVLRAGRVLPMLIDVEETEDRIISPFALMRLTLDGARVTERNLAIRYRHHSWLFEVNSIAAETGFWERDCWLSRRNSCRSGDNATGWNLVGSNHSSLWEACTITACDDVHLLIGNQGTAPDGNAALTWRTCDIEFGKGHGVVIAFGTNVMFEGCYLGENIGGDVLRNNGFVNVSGGVFFFGGGKGVGIRPLGGVVNLEGVSINAQAGGIPTLLNLTSEEAAEIHGKVMISQANANLPVGGDPLLQGDPLARIPIPVFAPRLGRDWQAWADGVPLDDVRSPDGLPDGREVRFAGRREAQRQFGLRAKLADTRWRESLPVYFACVYRSTVPVELRLRAPQTGQRLPFAGLPASPERATYVNVSAFLPTEGFSEIEAAVAAVNGAAFGLQELTLGDGMNFHTPSGNLKTLALAQ